MSHKPLQRPGASKLISLIPNIPQSPGLMPTADSESTVASDRTKPETDDPSSPAGKVGGLGDSLPSPHSCMPHHIGGMAGEQLFE